MHAHDYEVNSQLEEREWDIRLVSGETVLEGRVEICFDYQWGTVCGATVMPPLCRQLGFSAEGVNLQSQYLQVHMLVTEDILVKGQGRAHTPK